MLPSLFLQLGSCFFLALSDALLSEHVTVFQALPIRKRAEFRHCVFVKELALAMAPKVWKGQCRMEAMWYRAGD